MSNTTNQTENTASKPKTPLTDEQLEYLADLLKERIYATLALLAVLISLDTNHASALKAAAIVGGTILSLWAASLVSTQMARRMYLPHKAENPVEVKRQLRRHAPLLASSVFPLFTIGLSAAHLISLSAAVSVSILGLLILLVGWSLASARAMKARKLPTSVLAAIEVLIGLSVVGLKLWLEH